MHRLLNNVQAFKLTDLNLVDSDLIYARLCPHNRNLDFMKFLKAIELMASLAYPGLVKSDALDDFIGKRML